MNCRNLTDRRYEFRQRMHRLCYRFGISFFLLEMITVITGTASNHPRIFLGICLFQVAVMSATGWALILTAPNWEKADREDRGMDFAFSVVTAIMALLVIYAIVSI